MQGSKPWLDEVRESISSWSRAAEGGYRYGNGSIVNETKSA